MRYKVVRRVGTGFQPVFWELVGLLPLSRPRRRRRQCEQKTNDLCICFLERKDISQYFYVV